MTYSELVSDVKFFIAGDSTKTVDYTAADINTALNQYYNEVISIILGVNGSWEWDDTNYTNLPVFTDNIVSGQADYSLDLDSGTVLNFIKLRIKDSSGTWIDLEPIGHHQKEWIEGEDAASGTPEYYDKVGESIILYPTPNYSSSEGLKIYIQRTPDYFTTGDTTQAPGFNPLYHRYLSLGAALDYCVVNSMTDRANYLMAKLTEMKQRIMADFSRRSRDEKLSTNTYAEDFGQEGVEGYTVYPDKITW